MTIRHRRWRLFLAAGVVVIGFCLSARGGDATVAELLRYGTGMARDGNWREAKFRWEQALKQDPADPRLLNNLAVAAEALGAPDRAGELYKRALAAAGRDSRIYDNATRSAAFWGRAADADVTPLPSSESSYEWRRKRGRDVVEIAVTLPLPPRLKLDGVKTVLVASFLVNDSDLVDVNREIVRFLRAEFRKHTSYTIQDINPAPAVPEQTLEDLAKNAEFFKWLGHEHGSDVIVTGATRFAKRDASGFENVDIVSETTGQRVRQTVFVEQEEFSLELNALYFRGADGSLLFRDRLQAQQVFRGKANDPISAFYELGNSISSDVLSVVASRTRTDQRLLFKG
jgi:hypothetical protein